MEKAVPRLCLVISITLVLCLFQLLDIQKLDFPRRSFQITRTVNNFFIPFSSPKRESLNFPVKFPYTAPDDLRANRATRLSEDDKETGSISSQTPDIENLGEIEFRGDEKEEEGLWNGSPEPKTLNITDGARNARETDFRANNKEEESDFGGSTESEITNLTAEKEFGVSPDAKQRLEEGKMDSCAGRYVYMHELPSKFNDNVIKNCRPLIIWFDMCPSMVNSGLGPKLVDNTKRVFTGADSWYATNQFLLEVIFREKMKHYECLTNDSSLASTIYVPFYAGFDVSRHLWGYNVTVRDKLVNELAKWLSERPEWRRSYGRDHFLVSGRIAWDFRRISDKDSDWGNKLMRLPEFANTTLLSIEATAWRNEIAIPYPTYFHPTSQTEVIEWQRKVKRANRRFLFSFIGAPRPEKEESIRGEIIKQCLASQGRCKFLNCIDSGTDCDNPVKVMEIFQSSVFCLQPQGDSATRRSIFDSILAGCIPVFFHPASAYNQYTWYFPRDHTKYSVYIPEESLRNQTVSIEKSLLPVNQKQISEMRNEVVRLIPKIIYAKPGRVKPGMVKDAFGIAVDRIVERVQNSSTYLS